MLADMGLNVLYETDEVDHSGIKSVYFMYGRQTKCLTDSAGERFHVADGNHAVLFKVAAYTSSGAEIYFHNPVDLKDFMQQVIQWGVIGNSDGSYTVCDKPMGQGVHKLKELYEPGETTKGAFKELYYLTPEYIPGAEWHTCYVTLDFLRHRLDIE